jgi:hypothetical protein
MKRSELIEKVLAASGIESTDVKFLSVRLRELTTNCDEEVTGGQERAVTALLADPRAEEFAILFCVGLIARFRKHFPDLKG